MSRTALLTAAGVTLAACTTTSQFEAPTPNFPVQTPAEAAAPAPDVQSGGEAPPQARPTAPVESRPIEPPRPGAASTPRNGVQRVANTDAAPASAGRTVTRTVTGGRVVDIDVEAPGKTHKVKEGETLYRIALGFGMKPEELARLNGLKAPWVIRPGQVLKGPGAKTTTKAYVVGEGDTLSGVAQRFSVGVTALASANGIKSTAGLRPGQRLKLPAGYKDKGPQTVTVARAAPAAPPPTQVAAAQQPAPRAAPPPPAASPAPPPEPEARTQLAAATPPPSARSASLSAPTSSALPPPVAASPPPAAATPAPPMARQAPPPARSAAEPPRPTTLASVQPTRPPATPPAAARPQPAPPSAPALVPSTPPAGDAQIASLGRGRFVWPVRGALISGFGPKGGNQRNDGVNIRAPMGETVRAVAAGDVVYAGDQVPGFGNLVLIKHADGWVSAYGHLSRLDVKIQQKVGQGQQIGQVGTSGGVPEPQLHFEIRYAPTPQDRARPIDPQLVLPQS